MTDLEKEPANLRILVIIVLMMAGAIYLYEKPFEATRPVGRKDSLSTSLGPQYEDARLWQDPFTGLSELPVHDGTIAGALTEVVRSLRPNPEESRRTGKEDTGLGKTGISDQPLAELQRALKKYLHESKEIIVMPVMVFGGGYAENIEGRRRARYAVLAALAASEYTPTDSEHVGYFQMPWFDRFVPNEMLDADACLPSTQTEREPPQNISLAVPYEWLEQDPGPDGSNLLEAGSGKTSIRRVLVLWLNDDLFSDRHSKDSAE